MHASRALVVDDEPKVRALLRNCLEEVGLSVTEAADADSALDQARTAKFDLITLDLHLGAEDGLSVARTVRAESDVPIIMVTGRNDVIDRVVGLEVGADDYITKPFHVREVLARIKAVLRRYEACPEDGREVPSSAPESEREKSGGKAYLLDGLKIRPDCFELRDREGLICELTSGDFQLLTIFLERPKRVLSRAQIMDRIGRQMWTPLDRTIDNQVARLRKKIERDPSNPKLIKTVRGIGYTLASDLESVPHHDAAKRA